MILFIAWGMYGLKKIENPSLLKAKFLEDIGNGSIFLACFKKLALS
jgi:hypothetical protein